ncbi:10943_t:CDS:2 [Cetraspora pellucida]|uniref:10943_t:CDS:1 n=1 Tax=Cetraspora pellucida TaxID=1433469 RepID=A0ACA9L297_9GLOM|nr:10943_t:CDS:2 [Cetraspora pellucida]
MSNAQSNVSLKELNAKLLAEIAEIKVENDELKNKNVETIAFSNKIVELETERTELKTRIVRLLRQSVEENKPGITILDIEAELCGGCPGHLREPLAELWNTTNDQIPVLLAIEANLTMVDEILKPLLEEHSTSFGGTYINVITNRIIINTVDYTKVDIIISRMESYKHLFIFKNVTNSLVTLRNSFDQISEQAKSLRPLNIACFIDMEVNNIVLYIWKGYNQYNRVFLEAIEPYNVIKRFVNQSSGPPPDTDVDDITIRTIATPILGGDGIINKVEDKLCSVGFWAKSKDLKTDYIVTAKHCALRPNSFFNHIQWNKTTDISYFTLGYMLQNFKSFDIGLIAFIGHYTFKLEMTIRNVDSANSQLIIYDDEAVSSYGAHICKSGYTTHVTCGFIKGFNGFFINERSQFNSQAIFSTAKVIKGDSGGTVFSYKQNLRHASLNGITNIGGEDSNNYIHGYLPIKTISREFQVRPVLAGDSGNTSTN